MSGMISTGGGYQRNALSGFARLSEQEQQRETANKQMSEQQDQANTQLAASGASAAAMIAVLAFL